MSATTIWVTWFGSMAVGPAVPADVGAPVSVDTATPLEHLRSPPSSSIPEQGGAPLSITTPHESSTIPREGLTPFDGRDEPEAVQVEGDQAEPLGYVPAAEDRPPTAMARPFGAFPPDPVRAFDPRAIRMIRSDLMFGAIWRVHRADTMLLTSVEVGPMQGLSASLHTAVMVDSQREVVKAIDVPIGIGGLWRGRARKLPLFASIGLTVGMLVHRAKSERGVVHRIDPDFRLPIRLAWTIAKVGLSVTLEQGYSVRNRSYERRGVEVWSRHAYRVGLAVGVHWDVESGRAVEWRRTRRRSR